MEAFPPHFRCPISMELMKDPVTIFTGVTYERKNIERWFFTYKKKTCPATMQIIDDFGTTPNHTLKRLILAWQIKDACSSSMPPHPLATRDEVVTLLHTVESSPFKVSCLKKLRSIIETGDEARGDFIRSNGVEIVVNIVVQILVESSDFDAFEACEEGLGVLSQLSLSKKEKIFELITNSDCIKAMSIVLHRGSAEARHYTIKIFQKIAKSNYDWNFVIDDQGMDFFKSLLELVSDEICTKASSCALEVLLEILAGPLKKSRLKVIEAGAIQTLIELLPDSSRSKCEKMLHIIKQLCECAEGRTGFVEHEMSIAAVTKKMLNVSNVATKIGVKILWLICNNHTTERVLEEMMVYGTVKKLLTLLHMEGGCSTKEKVIKMLKLHGNSWRRFPCFPCEWKDCMKIADC